MSDEGRKSASSEPGKGKRRSPRKQPPTIDQRVQRVISDLVEIGHALASRYGHVDEGHFPVDELILPVTVPLGQVRKRAQAASLLLEQYNKRIAETIRAHAAFLRGHVHCFQCGSSTCQHSTPNHPTEVFVGYSATGKARWQSFVNLCLERKDERVDRLFADRPEIVALTLVADDLKGELLPGFGKSSLVFNVLGQVVAGLVNEDLTTHGNGQDRFALAVQIIETGWTTGPRRLRVNLVGLSREDLARLVAQTSSAEAPERLRRTLNQLENRLKSLQRRIVEAEMRGERPYLPELVEPVLTRLRTDIERVLRRHRHRTGHAQQRHLGGERPTSNALSDAESAPDERLFLDSRKDTIIVLGKKNRAHVFSRTGRHITSLQLQPGELERKTRLNHGRARWRPLPTSDCDAFRARLQR